MVILLTVLTTAVVLSQRPSFPSGTSLVFSMGHDSYDLFSVQPTSGFGADFHTLFRPGAVFDDRYVTGVDCSPDSRSLIFWYIYLYRFDLANDQLTRIVLGNGMSQASVWSPDGTHIAYIDNVTTDRAQREILVIDADGSNKRQITANDDQETSLSWSPDGRQIAFTYVRGTRQGLAAVDVASGTSTPLHEAAAEISGVSWSPDGKQIAFDLSSAIYTIQPDGTQLRRLTDDRGNIAPRWSPDGTLISYSSRSSAAHYQLYVMNADGSNPYLVFPTIADQDVFNQCWLNRTT